MSLIKALLVASVLLILLWAFRRRARVGMRAGIRLVAVLLTVAAIWSIIDPGLTQDAANLVGVTRGTDLVLYVLVVVFAFTTVSMFLRFRELERRLTQVIRTQAINDAISRQGPPAGSHG